VSKSLFCQRAPACILGAILCAIAPVRASETGHQVTISIGATGLTSLRDSGREMLADGGLRAENVVLGDWDGAIHAGSLKMLTTSCDRASRTVTQSYAWGVVRAAYTTQNNRLNVAVSVTNNSLTVVRGLTLSLAEIKLPASSTAKAVEAQALPSVDAPGIIAQDWGGGTIAFCNEAVGRPLYIAFLPTTADTKSFALQVATRRDDRFPRGWLSTPQIDRPLFPGDTDRFTLSLRFGPSGASATQLAGDIIQRYVQAYPFRLNWKDRRPIGALHLATSEYRLPKNPRGWFNGDRTLDTTTPAGLADFHDRLMKYADDSIAVLKDMNAQGMIVWDLEGEEYPHATTYIGDPRSLPAEIEPLADAFFKKFTDAGLRVGLCIRPSVPVRRLYGSDALQMQIDDPATLLNEKVAYAHKRWGCTIFYVDSNVIYDPHYKPNDGAGYELMPATVFQKVAAANPDVLLIPEQKSARYYAHTAPYGELRLGVIGTPEAVRQVYPDSFSVVYVPDGPADQRRADLIAAVKRGDILLFRGWWPDPYNAQIKAIYHDAAR
jgi:hypothetical protein